MGDYSNYNQPASAPTELRPRHQPTMRKSYQYSPPQYTEPALAPIQFQASVYEDPRPVYEDVAEEYSEPQQSYDQQSPAPFFDYELQSAPKMFYGNPPMMFEEPAYSYNQPLLEPVEAPPAMSMGRHSYHSEPTSVLHRGSSRNVAEMAKLMSSRMHPVQSQSTYSAPNPYNPDMGGNLDQAISDLNDLSVKGQDLESALRIIASSQDASEKFSEIKSALQRRANANRVDDVVAAVSTPEFCQNVFRERKVPLTMPQGSPQRAAHLNNVLCQQCPNLARNCRA
jgi:hypothetical protein